jgi:pilus assembly protein CpaB
MNPARIIVLVIALAAGGLAALLASRSGPEAPPQVVQAPPQKTDTTEVLIATADIGVGQPVTPQNMAWVTWPAANAGPQFIQKKTNPDALASMSGSIVRIAFANGEPIREAKVIKAGSSGYIAALLPSGMRAVAMEISPEAGAGGFILPSDHVDIILTRVEKLGNEENFSVETILADVQVLAIDQTVEEKNGQRVIVGKIATVAISPRQTETLALARRMGALSLALRGLRDTNQPGTNVSDAAVTNRQSINIVRYGRSTSTLK